MIYDIPYGLRRARTSKGYTQKQVANILNITKETLSNYENGKTEPDMITVIKLSDIYDCPLDTLLGYKKPPKISTPNKEDKYSEFRNLHGSFDGTDRQTDINELLNKLVEVLNEYRK